MKDQVEWSQEADETTAGNEADHLSDQGGRDRSRPSSKLSTAETPCPISSLPFELLHLILEYAIPPHLFLDPAVRWGPSSAWCLAMLQLRHFVLVSRWWREVSIDLLYCHVVIRHIGQLTTLLRSLEASPQLGPCVRSLHIDCFVPPKHEPDFEDHLNRVCALCTQNTHLILNHTTAFDDDGPTIDGNILSSIVALSNLTRLTIVSDYATPNDIPAIQLPLLEELHCPAELAVICRQWSLPRLRRLLILTPQTVHLGHGVSLSRTDTDLNVFLNRGYRTIQQLLDLCSSLKHLVIVDCRDIDRLSHTTLEYLDIWRDISENRLDGMAAQTRLPSFSKKHLPSLRKTRLLHEFLRALSGDGTRLPILVPPDFVGDKSVEWIYPSVGVMHSTSLMCPLPSLGSSNSDGLSENEDDPVV
ncbi:hypothetical protein BU15DRAFT_76013 [Melanogaster broomeanus]|nr:hypothetical protein BU15DRAFT_76013 [Melanogaster broomeanus]